MLERTAMITMSTLLLATGGLLSPRLHAAEASHQGACTALSMLRDQGVISLETRARQGRCEVDIEAASGRALVRQQRVVEAIAQAVCAALPVLTPDPLGAPKLSMRMPAGCAELSATALFGADASGWIPPRSLAPRYPPAAVEQGLQGRSWVAMIVGRDGTVVATILRQSSGHPILDDAALADVRTWRFTRADPAVVPPRFTLAQVPMTYLLD